MRRAAVSRSTVKLLAPPASSPAPAITRQLYHCICLTWWFIPQQITKHIFIDKCSKLAATLQLANLRAFVEASYASHPSQRKSSLLSYLPRAGHVLRSSAMRERVGKLAATLAFPLTAAKTVLQRNLSVVLDQSGRKLAISKRILMGKLQKRPWTSSTEPWTRFDRPLNVFWQTLDRL